MLYAWVILAASVFLIGPSINQLDVEVIYIAGGTLSMQALVGRSLDFMPQLVDLSFLP